MMCLGLNGFVSSPVPSSGAPVASTAQLARIRPTAYVPIATTTTRSSGIHPFLNSRNTLSLLTFGACGVEAMRGGDSPVPYARVVGRVLRADVGRVRGDALVVEEQLG